MMKKYFLIVLVLLPSGVMGQGLKVDLIKFEKLDFNSTKALIIEVMGEPTDITEPKYECGFLSSDEQGKEFFMLNYENVNFVGNDKDGYLIHELNFNDGISITYNGSIVNKESSLDHLIDVFGMDLFGSFHDTSTDSKLMRFDGSDDGIMIYLTNGKLSKMVYWSPC